MRIKFVEISNFRKLKNTHIDFDPQTTIFVGANNSGKTSAMVALRYFLVSPHRLALRDITLANWTKLDALGEAWECEAEANVNLDDLLPRLDLWLDVPLSEIRHIAHILPTLDWNGGLLGVRLQYRVEHMEKLKSDYLRQRVAVCEASAKISDDEAGRVQIWPTCLTNYLERRLRTHVGLETFALDPSAHVPPENGFASPQALRDNALPLEKNLFKNLIRIDEIEAQRDFADAGVRDQSDENAQDKGSHHYKRRLSDQLRSYYDRHLDPAKMPSPEDYVALGAIQIAERNFDKKLEDGFAAAFEELDDHGYPGMANPKLKISTQLRATDGLKHGSAVQYQMVPSNGEGTKALQLPEDYLGLGYQNLIAMVFMLMSFRDAWMRVGKASACEDVTAIEPFQPLHLVLVEEPEAHLHAQVQQVFIKKAFKLLRKHDNLGDNADLSTQLIVSTHSSHIAHEADFANLRYFRRRPAISTEETPTTTVANLSYVFGEGDITQRFVKRYLKTTHCDLFFADGIIFVEGQAERILVPHFIRQHFGVLSRRYITLLDLGGSHAHNFKELVSELGLTTLIIADLDATKQTKVTTKAGVETTRWKATKPQRGANQKTSNPVLKEWHPAKELIDELVSLEQASHELLSSEGYKLYVSYQKPITVRLEGQTDAEVIPRTFEDALIFENIEALEAVTGSRISEKIKLIIGTCQPGDELEDELFELLKSAEKAAFALDCLMLENPKALVPPSYINDGLTWFEHALGDETSENEPGAGKI